MSQSTLSDLERGENTGRTLELLARLVRVLEVSADSLLGLGDEASSAPLSPGLSKDEAQLVRKIRQLSPERRGMATRSIALLHEEEARWQRYVELMSAIEVLDQTGLMGRVQDRLLTLAGELGSFGAALTVLAGELAASREPGSAEHDDLKET